MATKQIYVAPLQKEFTVEVDTANRKAKSTSYRSACSCAEVTTSTKGKKVVLGKFRQEMRCEKCNVEKSASTDTRKIVKVGTDELLIDASAIASAQQALEAIENVKLHTFLNKKPTGTEDRIESLIYDFPADKKAKHYAELAKLLKGRWAIGNGVFGKNEYQVLATCGDDDVVRFWTLVEERNRKDHNFEECASVVNGINLPEQVVALENELLDKATVDDYDLTKFVDTRTEVEQNVIEDFVVNGKLPEAPPTAQIEEEQAEDEVARLKALMG